MSRVIKIHFAAVLVRVALGVVFVAASAYKIATPEVFANEIYNFRLFPAWAINPIAIVLPWLQLFCGLTLVVNRWAFAASCWTLVMMAGFQFAVGSALVRDLNIACGCFRPGGDPATWWTFGRDAVIAAAAALNLLWLGRMARQ